MRNISSQRPTWAEIDLDNLAFNFRSVKAFIGPEIKYMAVVKADAYGHGAVECAKRLEAEGADWFGVALPEEGLELREAGIRKRILCLGGFWEGQESTALNYNLTPVVFQIEKARQLNDAATSRGTVVAIHVKVDTGMGRVGVRHDHVRAFAEELKTLDHLRLEGVMTHFASADDLSDSEFTDAQTNRFEDSVAIFRERGFNPAYLDLANSPGAVAHPNSRANMVRLGGVLYGLGGDVLPRGIEKPELRPVLSLYTRIAHLKKVPAGETLGYGRTFVTTRDSIIATIPIGYDDGYRRGLSNAAKTIIRDTYAPVVGRVSMDWTILDVTDVAGVEIGDDVTLIGERDGMRIAAEDLAAAVDTISYEITCGINQRVPRVYRP
jgi:alanine racemase